MNRDTHRPSLLGPSGLFLAALLGWGLVWSGCAEEDTVATIVTPDASVGPFVDGEGTGEVWPGDAAPDAGTPDAGAGE